MAMTSRDEFDEVSRLLLIVADDLDARLIPTAGVIRRAARLLCQANPRQRATPTERICPSCGAPLSDLRRRGRPQEYCSRRCRDGARYSRNAEG